MSVTTTLDESLREALLPELELIRPLGSGASADVYLAREPALQRLVAVKVLRDDGGADAVMRQRFQREAQSAARIAHPNVTAIYRVGTTGDGRPFIVLEYVEGRTLADMLATGTPFELTEARRILAVVASALAAAHERGIIHRDVRPGNVLIENRTGRAVLGDFGIAALLDSGSAAAARLTAAGVVLGDTRYLSPELARGEPVVEQSDVYAFGIVAYELLTGRGPYTTKTAAEQLVAHLRQEPASLRSLRPDIDPAFAALITRCLAKDANQRPLAREIAAQLGTTTSYGAAHAPAHAVAADAGPFEQFLGELRRRHVYQVLAAYTAIALALFGIAQVVFEAFELSQSAYRIFVAVTLGGFPVAMVLAWLYDIRAGGIQRTAGTGTGGRTHFFMWAGLAFSLLLAMVIGWMLLRE
jgi:serine/threonine protein kinase